jgi:hypothetical protein
MVGFYECHNEPSGSIKGEKIIGQMSNYHVVK